MTPSRRVWLKLASGAALAAPLAALPLRAQAAKNEALRKALNYQDQPKGEQQCSNCMHWVPGKSPTELGGCKVIPGDTEISPKGWSTAWAKRAS
jgi:anaerobic selenocysteine-containing dehydrogenase